MTASERNALRAAAAKIDAWWPYSPGLPEREANRSAIAHLIAERLRREAEAEEQQA